MSESEQNESGSSVSIQLPWAFAMRPRKAVPLLPQARSGAGVKVVATTCVRCGRTSWRDEVALCTCRGS